MSRQEKHAVKTSSANLPNELNNKKKGIDPRKDVQNSV